MPQQPNISIIICTHNNADSLRRTLSEFCRIKLQELTVELIVVDNASTDQTADVVRESKFGSGTIYLHQPLKGLSRARNAGLKVSRGDVILFTDDDVIPSTGWIEKMSSPLLKRQCDALTGRIELAKNLRRDWMEGMHDAWLAAARVVHDELVGACMGFHRTVLERVPEFDSELGAGALGFGEDTLFSKQLLVAGYRFGTINEPCVEHHPRESRLVRREWLAAARSRGRSSAYVIYHWEHRDLSISFIMSRYYALKLWARRLFQRPPALDEEGCPSWELSYIFEMEKHRGFIRERERPRNYDKYGLRKNAVANAI